MAALPRSRMSNDTVSTFISFFGYYIFFRPGALNLTRFLFRVALLVFRKDLPCIIYVVVYGLFLSADLRLGFYR